MSKAKEIYNVYAQSFNRNRIGGADDDGSAGFEEGKDYARMVAAFYKHANRNFEEMEREVNDLANTVSYTERALGPTIDGFGGEDKAKRLQKASDELVTQMQIMKRILKDIGRNAR